MKKLYLVVLSLLTIFLVACNQIPSQDDPIPTVKYDLTFMVDQTTVHHVFKVELGSPMQYPTDPVKEGYIFTGWYAGEVKFEGDVVTATALTLYAHFVPDTPVVTTYTVTFYDGEELYYSTQVERGKTVTDVIDTTREHYTFDGWFIDQNLENNYGLYNPIYENTVLYGKWSAIYFTVTFYRGMNVYTTESVQSGQMIPTIDTEIDGYEFVGWYTNSMLSTTYTPSAISGDISLYGKWNEVVNPDPDPDPDPNPDNDYTGYYSSLDGLSDAQLVTALRSLIKNTGSNTGSTNQVKQVDAYSGAHYLIYTGLGTYGNREHTVPATYLRKANAPEDDLHNLRASLVSVNSDRGSLPFGNRVGGGGYKDLGGSWYPGDEHIGDVARIVFYVHLRHNVPISNVGNISMFLTWHEADPVNEFERTRNGRIQSIQNNRNPFIDHPELAYKVWPTSTKANTDMIFMSYTPSFTFNQIFVA